MSPPNYNSPSPNVLPRSWTWRTILDCEIPSSPDTLRVLLVSFVFMAWSSATKFTDFALSAIVKSSRFLQREQDLLKNKIVLRWSPAPSPFAQQMFFDVSTALWCSSNSRSISSRIRLHCMFIRAAFKSYPEEMHYMSVHQIAWYSQTQLILPQLEQLRSHNKHFKN